MVALIKNNIQAIQDLCKKHDVRSLYLAGSAAKENSFTDKSDVDFLYRFRQEDIKEMDYADNNFDLLFELQDMLNRKVDQVAAEKMKNPNFIESINKNKLVIYES